MSRFSQLRTRYLSSSDSTLSAQSIASLSQAATTPPERLHRSAGSPDDSTVLYIFRIPGRRELCLSNLKPGGDVVTDIDVSAALYILRFDAADSCASITLLRAIDGQMKEVAFIEDPPGHVDVFEEAYSRIEPRYWDVHGLRAKAVKASFSCQVTATDEGLSFQTPWVGLAQLAPVKLGNALRCYHAIRHAEGDEARQRMQVSELRFNFQMPKGVAPARETASKRASIAQYLHSGSSEEKLGQRSALASASDHSDMLASVHESAHVADNAVTTQRSWKRRSRLDPSSLFSNPPIAALPASYRTSFARPSDYSSLASTDANADTITRPNAVQRPGPSKEHVSPAVSTGEAVGRIKGPRPMRNATNGKLNLDDGATQGSVLTGRPVEMANAVNVQPQSADNDESVNNVSSPMKSQPSQPSSIANGPSVANSRSGDAAFALRAPSIKRKPVRTATLQGFYPSARPLEQGSSVQANMSGDEPPTTISKRLTDPIDSTSSSPIRRRPVLMFDTFEASETKEAAYSRPGSIKQPPPLTERPNDQDMVKPALPPRRTTDEGSQNPYPRKNSLLDLSLGQEKLGGGFDGEQAKLGKLIIQPEGQKMLDLIVAANMLAFHRAFVAADVIGR